VCTLSLPSLAPNSDTISHTKTLFIEPGSPRHNSYIESFTKKLRDELLNWETLTTLEEAGTTS